MAKHRPFPAPAPAIAEVVPEGETDESEQLTPAVFGSVELAGGQSEPVPMPEPAPTLAPTLPPVHIPHPKCGPQLGTVVCITLTPVDYVSIDHRVRHAAQGVTIEDMPETTAIKAEKNGLVQFEWE